MPARTTAPTSREEPDFFEREMEETSAFLDIAGATSNLTELSLSGFLAPFEEEKQDRSCLEFVKHALGHDPWDGSVQIMSKIEKPRARVAVKACHASSKTFTAAEVALWWVVEKGGLAITTAPVGRQVRSVMWPEIRRAHKNAKERLGGHMLRTELRFSEHNYLTGFATNETVNWQGFHSDRTLIIVDEAPGVNDEHFDAMLGIAAGGDTRILMLGNPVIIGGEFWNAFSRESSAWDCMTIDAFDTPNIAPLELHDPEKLKDFISWKSTDPRLAENVRPYLCTRHYVHEAALRWGVDSPQWQARVRGEFPSEDENALFSLTWLERAKNKEVSPGDDPRAPIVAGLDIGGAGRDKTVLVIREGVDILGSWSWDKADTLIDVLQLCRQYQSRADQKGKSFRIHIDSQGIGYHYMLELKRSGMSVLPFNPQASPKDKDRFATAKDEDYWRFRELLRNEELRGLTDEECINQAIKINWSIDTRGRNRVESKDELAKRGINSPDNLDAHVLAFSEPRSLAPSSRRRSGHAGKSTRKSRRVVN